MQDRRLFRNLCFLAGRKANGAAWDTRCCKEEAAAAYERKARCVEENIHKLWDAQAEAFFAADGDCRQHDVWGMLYAWAIGFPMEESLRRHDRMVARQPGALRTAGRSASFWTVRRGKSF